MTIPNNMTVEQYAEQYNQRQSLLKSSLMDSSFDASDAARHLSDYRNGRPVSKDQAGEFLAAMVRDGLIKRASVYGKARWHKLTLTSANGAWGVNDNGVRIGLHCPPIFNATVE